jgi:hypothetical protein
MVVVDGGVQGSVGYEIVVHDFPEEIIIFFFLIFGKIGTKEKCDTRCSVEFNSCLQSNLFLIQIITEISPNWT